MVFGWTWAHIRDNVTLPEVEAMSRYWKKFPPVHFLVGAFMGCEGAQPQAKQGSAEDLMAMFPPQNSPDQPVKADSEA
ncbi:hypothetical protein [Microbulbifer sp. 2205BS26-8]|uniref:hypothetical protein n=1 Tax=Microbulbifer sp. 2205BS26-8 TaxID=3064386 RepID=UPI00273CF8C0|nr:hypothetical protein [Microbulbifer sp. 2205BS26-8]MDP5209993.1 hypothetical protein [Microbulbifer sp. 2205BS26-8]